MALRRAWTASPPFRLHRRMGIAVGFACFFDLYDIFLCRSLPESPRWHEIRGEHEVADRETTAMEEAARAEPGPSELPEPEDVQVTESTGQTTLRDLHPALPAPQRDAVGLLGPRSTGMNLEMSSDDTPGTRTGRFARQTEREWTSTT